MSPDLLERLKSALADRYAVESEIGRGGMAVVFLAEDLKHGRQVAIKVLHPDLAASVGGDRFLREIEIAARLEHPHILSLIDSGEADGLFYYVMPYVDGESLRDRLEREQQLPIEEAIRIAREVADGLGHAHRQGVVHRDIKPANVLLSEGHALIADFGVARAVGAEGQGLTSTGLAVGTPAYMSPEQASSAGEADARSDLYALGCMLYEMLAGEPPLTGPTPQATATLRLTETATSLPVLRETVPGGLDRVVARSLAKSPADRYGTAEELAEALVAPEVWEEVKPRRKIGRRVVDGVIAVVLLGAGVFLAQMFVGGGPTVELSESRIAVLPLVPTVRGDTALENLGNAVAARIRANLQGIGDIETVPYQTIRANETAAGGSLEDAAYWARDETGAGRVVHGSLVRTGDEVSLEVNLLSSGDLGAVAQASYTARTDDPRLLADSISWQILGQLWTAGETPVEYYDHLVGRPFPAVRDFLIAQSFYSQGWEVDKAVRALERAFKADTTLWVASVLYEYFTTDYPGAVPEVDSTISNAHWQHIEDVPTPYREFVEAQRLFRERRYEERLDLYEAVLAEHPGFWLVAMDYGNDLVFWGYLFGYTADDVIQAQAACVDNNPDILECWIKLVLLSQGKDLGTLRRAYEYLDANLEQIPSSMYPPEAHQFVRLLMAYEEGEPPVALMDSVTRGLDWLRIGTSFPYGIWLGGLPQIFHDLHQRRQELSIDAEIPPAHLYWNPYAWAMRGAWDSTLVTLDRYVRESSDELAPLKAFKLTAIGEWLGGVPRGTSDRYLPRATAVAERLEDPDDRATERAMLDYMQGVLAAARQDSEVLRRADRQLEGIDHRVARTAQRALAAYALQLRGSVAEAADSLYEVTWHPPRRMLAINRINGSRWLLTAGDTARATKLVSSCQHSNFMVPEWDESRLLAGHCYLELARIEEASGRHGLAREYYWQFLKRYDSPVEALRPMVEEAREAYVRVGGDPERLPPLLARAG